MKLNPTTLFLAGLLSFATLLAGCRKPTQIAFLDKVMTADEFTAQPDLREKVLTYCANDSGPVGSDPNCVNAQQSARRATSGSGNFPRFDTSPPSNSRKN